MTKIGAVLLVLLSTPSAYSLANNNNNNKSNRRPLRQRPGSPIQIERDLVERRGSSYEKVIGSDESGRGCLAGPVVMASCCITADLSTYTPIQGVDDSKRLSKEERTRIYNEIMAKSPDCYQWAITTRSNTEIDASTVQDATLDGFKEAIQSVADKVLSSPKEQEESLYSIVDGHRSPSHLPFPSRPWKGGDEIVYTVALASILARVSHDAIMEQIALEYPEYGFEAHRGYPSRNHTQALHDNGPCPLHRQSCKPVRGRELSRKDFVASLVVAGSSTLVAWGRPQESSAMTNDPKTGIALPDVGEIETAIPNDWTGIDNPLEGNVASVMGRLDSNSDAIFYSDPRFVEHVDTQAVQLMTDYISNVAVTADTKSVLDVCSSWTSHLETQQAVPLQRVAGLGMNAKELEANKALTEWTIQDLNEKPVLPYADASFDVVLLQLSIDYLTRPLNVCKEIGRVLKSGGKVHILFSNRLFLSKAVGIWTGADDIDHAFTAGSYLHFCDGGFTRIEARDLSVRKGRDKRISGDPLYVVTAVKA